jgi:hypothetical protein
MVDLTKFNPNDFSFGTFTFRDITIELTPTEATEFSRDVDMRPKGENIIVRVQGTFTNTTGEIRFYMIAYDPETMDLTENPYLGILYPNIAPPEGDGNFTYRIGLRQDLPDGTVISNQAEIFFDLNEPIVTNTYINTLDLSKPESSMSFVSSEKNDSTFIISWNGSDTGSGIRDYTIYVSENDGDYTVWQYNTTETSAEFTGNTGAVYRFYCIATDNVGNREDAKPYEISIDVLPTSVQDVLSDSDIKIYPNPATDGIFIESSIPIQSYEIINMTGNKLVSETVSASLKIHINMQDYAAGIYFVKIKMEKGCVVKKVIKE